MSVPSMVHRSGDTLVVRSVVSGDSLFGDDDQQQQQQQHRRRRCVQDKAALFALPTGGDSKDLPECKVKRNYSCSRCDFFTQNPRSFLYHLRDVHKEKVRIYECPNCLYASKHYQKLLRHTKMVHGSSAEAVTRTTAATTAKKKKVVVDDEDDDQDNNAADDSDQYENKEDEQEKSPPPPQVPVALKCTICTFVAKTTAQLNKHEREEHIKSKFYRCTKCTYATHMKARFTKHVKYHSMPMIKCDMCDFRTPYKWNLDRHCKNHNGRGGFRCSACNFTADIKQSLTVHEMNHHVPPVGQAGGLGVGRRRNKVGASDSTAAEDAVHHQTVGNAESAETSVAAVVPDHQLNHRSSSVSKKRSHQESDFVHPDDIVQHANGKVYIKNKCRFCSFKTAWDSEMLRHEQNAHSDRLGVGVGTVAQQPPAIKKKTQRPVPDLIPIKEQQQQRRSEPVISNTDMNKILNNCKNSSLRDFAPLFNSEDVFLKDSAQTQRGGAAPSSSSSSSFFDKFNLSTMEDLSCHNCGRKSKCLTEHTAHTKTCGRRQTNAAGMLAGIGRLSSTRCQYCRQRCKASKDLLLHLATCKEYMRQQQHVKEEPMEEDEEEDASSTLEFYPDNNNSEKRPHPMENKVFIWNKTEDEEIEGDPYDLVEERQQDADQYSLDYSINTQSPNSESSSSIANNNNNNNSYEMIQIFSQHQQQQHQHHQQQQQQQHLQQPLQQAKAAVVHQTSTPTSQDKIPTHGNDISIAQHKRVFKCPHCTFWASTASRFHVHIVGHLNKKPFECSLCAYRSNWRWDITKHIKLKSVRDPEHESAKVLMTDETGRRNYTKYNKYLTEIPSSATDSQETSGGMGTRPKDGNKNKQQADRGNLAAQLRPPPQLKPADADFFSKMSSPDKNKSKTSETKKTLWQCKKCNFRDPSKEKLLQHVKGHLTTTSGGASITTLTTGSSSSLGSGGGGGAASGGSSSSSRNHVHHVQPSSSSSATALLGGGDLDSEASLGGGGPARGQFRCGHCHQVSNWKHVIQRHCRLKHGGDIKVVVGSSSGREKTDSELGYEDGAMEVCCQEGGAWKCSFCSFATDDAHDYHAHLEAHVQGANMSQPVKCAYCNFHVSSPDDLFEHLKAHGVTTDLFTKHQSVTNIDGGGGGVGSEPSSSSKRYKCLTCPYVTNSKSQFTYHKQFHETKNGQYSCTECSYNVSKRHLLHQHLKVHGITVSPQKQNGEVLDFEEISDEIEEVHNNAHHAIDWHSLAEIPLVWFSKGTKYSKMYKCRYCPHVNLRKVNIQEHEKMHRERSGAPRHGDAEHRCPECNYVCNNAGVLSSHNKVHQVLYGTVHGLVDTSKSDEEQIRELGVAPNPLNLVEACYPVDDDEAVDGGGIAANVPDPDLLYFCAKCPARFFKEKEFRIHLSFHGARSQFKCEHCTYATKSKNFLLAHGKVHTEEYQQRSRELTDSVPVHGDHPQPEVAQSHDGAWTVADETTSSEDESDTNGVGGGAGSGGGYNNNQRKMHVPLSGTDLFQQKHEAEAADLTTTTTITPSYATTIRNGKIKEKKYKCFKCPNAFEKKEQYKHHMSLHGSNQQYRCTHCDYSVANYANYVQHEKKHATYGDLKEEDGDEENNGYDTSVLVSSGPTVTAAENKKPYECTMCPYTNSRRDAVDNHQRRHIKLSGVENAYTCKHCDYSVPQMHYLKDHTKLHFQPLKMHTAESYMTQDALELTVRREQQEGEDEDEEMHYDNSPEHSTASLNNNEGEKVFVHTQTGELVDGKNRESLVASSTKS